MIYSNFEPIHLFWVLGLAILTIALSAWQRLGLEGNILMATGRAVLQLLALGFAIELAFAFDQPWAVLVLIAVLWVVATIAARSRIGRKIPSLLLTVGGSLLVSVALILGYVVLLILRPDPWYAPQVWIPLAGILIGHAMNAATIAGERLVSTLNTSQMEIETHLSLGATPRQVTAGYRRAAIKAGVMPTLSTMFVVGLVTLPDLLAGQILGGASPLDAAVLQILVLLMMGLTTLIATLLVIEGIDRQFFNQAAQLTLH